MTSHYVQYIFNRPDVPYLLATSTGGRGRSVVNLAEVTMMSGVKVIIVTGASRGTCLPYISSSHSKNPRVLTAAYL